jgi:hypothetical protein
LVAITEMVRKMALMTDDSRPANSNGGCREGRLAVSPDGEPGQNYRCSGLELFFHHTGPEMQAITKLLRRGRLPSEVLALIAAEGGSRPAASPGRMGQSSDTSMAHCGLCRVFLRLKPTTTNQIQLKGRNKSWLQSNRIS